MWTWNNQDSNSIPPNPDAKCLPLDQDVIIHLMQFSLHYKTYESVTALHYAKRQFSFGTLKVNEYPRGKEFDNTKDKK